MNNTNKKTILSEKILCGFGRRNNENIFQKARNTYKNLLVTEKVFASTGMDT